MEHINQSLFLLINAAPDASGIVVEIAKFIADFLIWIVPLGLIIAWFRGGNATRQVMVAATLAGVLALLINQLISVVWYHPRPFEMGIGKTLIAHVQDSSFPSDHLTLIWAMAFNFLLHKHQQRVGGFLLLSGIPVAWARIYLGVHFTLDIIGGALVGLISAWVIFRIERRLLPTLMGILLRSYRTLFSGLIRNGWVRK
ncbi:MAG: undecaprenyl-diphosphatase [Gallionella sp.]